MARPPKQNAALDVEGGAAPRGRARPTRRRRSIDGGQAQNAGLPVLGDAGRRGLAPRQRRPLQSRRNRGGLAPADAPQRKKESS
jgi:hypothetical protein